MYWVGGLNCVVGNLLMGGLGGGGGVYREWEVVIVEL